MTVFEGDTVLYCITKEDKEMVERRYRHAVAHMAEHQENKTGVMVHVGNVPEIGQRLPMIVTKVWTSGCVNGQVLLDGNDTLWKTSVVAGSSPGQYSIKL